MASLAATQSLRARQFLLRNKPLRAEQHLAVDEVFVERLDASQKILSEIPRDDVEGGERD